MKMRSLGVPPSPRSPLPVAGWCWLGCRLLVPLALLTACAASVNQSLIATPTPYPIRSPVAAEAARPTPVAAEAAALATGRAALGAGDAVAAEAAFATAVAAAPADPDAYTARADARAARGDLTGALADLNAAVARAPERADLYLRRAGLNERLPDFVAAEADFNLALARDPASAAALTGRGELLVATADGDPARYQAALDDFNRAVALDPTNVGARLGRVSLLLARVEFRGDPEDLARARQELDKLADVRSEPAVLALQARLLAVQGDREGARRALGAAVSALPADAPPSDQAMLDATRAFVFLKAFEWSRAAAAATAALGGDPSRWEAYRLLAQAELGRGDAAAALAVIDRLLAKLPADGPALYLRGVALAALGRSTEARATLESARARLPYSPVYQAKIALATQGATPSASPIA